MFDNQNCGGSANPHNSDGTCAPLCESVPSPEPCCPTSLPMGKETCPVVVPVLSCPTQNRTVFHVPNNVNGVGLGCECLCIPEGVTFTAEQADAVKSMFDGLLSTLFPNVDAWCDCKPVYYQVGHHVPLNGDCCDGYDHSPFLNSGIRRNIGGNRPHFFTDMDHMSGADAADKVSKLFCCARDLVDSAVVAPNPAP